MRYLVLYITWYLDRVLRHFLGRLDFRDADYIDCNADPDPTPRKTGSGSDLSKYPDQDSTSEKIRIRPSRTIRLRSQHPRKTGSGSNLICRYLWR